MATAIGKNKLFAGKESKVEEKAEKQVGPKAYARGEKYEGKKSTSPATLKQAQKAAPYKNGGMVGKKAC